MHHFITFKIYIHIHHDQNSSLRSREFLTSDQMIIASSSHNFSLCISLCLNCAFKFSVGWLCMVAACFSVERIHLRMFYKLTEVLIFALTPFFIKYPEFWFRAVFDKILLSIAFLEKADIPVFEQLKPDRLVSCRVIASDWHPTYLTPCILLNVNDSSELVWGLHTWNVIVLLWHHFSRSGNLSSTQDIRVYTVSVPQLPEFPQHSWSCVCYRTKPRFTLYNFPTVFFTPPPNWTETVLHSVNLCLLGVNINQAVGDCKTPRWWLKLDG